MWPTRHPSAELCRLAELQAGVLSREQILGIDGSLTMLRRLVSRGTWHPVAPGVVAVHGGPLHFAAIAWAGVLLGGEGSAVAGRAAAHAYGLAEEPELVEVAMPYPRRRRDLARWKFTTRLEVSARGNPPRLSVEDTVLMLCRGQPDQIEGWIAGAIQRRRTTPTRLLARLSEHQRHPHRKAIRAALGDVTLGAESALEIDYLRSVERAHGLPQATRQRRRGTSITDAEYLGGLVIVELDGRAGHESTGQFRDMQRDNCHTLLGSRTLRYGYRDVRLHACRVAAQVAALLVQLGWDGELRRCRHCPETA